MSFNSLKPDRIERRNALDKLLSRTSSNFVHRLASADLNAFLRSSRVVSWKTSLTRFELATVSSSGNEAKVGLRYITL
jgi:hypothetical protein